MLSRPRPTVVHLADVTTLPIRTTTLFRGATQGFPQTDRHPAVCVSWQDAQAYVSWLSRTTGASYRLPTVPELRQAAVASPPGCTGRRSVFLRDRGEGTCPVGSYGANPLGLSDMLGNVGEWTTDRATDPTPPRRVLRGTTWYHEYASAVVMPSNRTHGSGIRVVRTLD